MLLRKLEIIDATTTRVLLTSLLYSIRALVSADTKELTFVAIHHGIQRKKALGEKNIGSTNPQSNNRVKPGVKRVIK